MVTATATIPRRPVVTVERLWPSSTIVCLASGPSLTQDDVDGCRGKAHVIAVNDTYRLAPWADVLYASDAQWWRVHRPEFAGLKYSISMTHEPARVWRGPSDGIQLLANTGREGLERAPTALRTGRNSGYAAINLAVHLGAARIVLLGYDLSLGAGGRRHFFGNHPTGLRNISNYTEWIQHFGSLVAPLAELGIEIVNCSRRTALPCFRQAPLGEVLG